MFSISTYIKFHSFSINSNFERGFECLKDMITVVFSYLENRELLNENFDLNQSIIDIVDPRNLNNFGGNKIPRDNIFFRFIIYNHYFYTFISNNQHLDHSLIFNK